MKKIIYVILLLVICACSGKNKNSDSAANEPTPEEQVAQENDEYVQNQLDKIENEDLEPTSLDGWRKGYFVDEFGDNIQDAPYLETWLPTTKNDENGYYLHIRISELKGIQMYITSEDLQIASSYIGSSVVKAKINGEVYDLSYDSSMSDRNVLVFSSQDDMANIIDVLESEGATLAFVTEDSFGSITYVCDIYSVGIRKAISLLSNLK